MPIEKMINGECMSDINVAHYRASEGYSDDRYDVINTDNRQHIFTVEVPAKSGDLYFSLNGYPADLIPENCTTYDKTENGVTTTYNMPLVYLPLYKKSGSGDYERVHYEYYLD